MRLLENSQGFRASSEILNGIKYTHVHEYSLERKKWNLSINNNNRFLMKNSAFCSFSILVEGVLSHLFDWELFEETIVIDETSSSICIDLDNNRIV